MIVPSVLMGSSLVTLDIGNFQNSYTIHYLDIPRASPQAFIGRFT